MHVSSTRGAPRVISDRLCAVYDQDTHDVLHLHRVATLEGGEAPDEDTVRARAMEHARAFAPAHGRKIGSTFVDPSGFQPGCSHKVDLNGGKLVARRPRPEPRGLLAALWAELWRWLRRRVP